MTLNKSILYPKLKLRKLGVTSGASRSSYFFKNYLPLEIKYKKLINYKKWKAGRNSKGKIILWTRGRKTIKHKEPVVNYKYRDLRLSFIGNFLMIPKRNKLVSLLFLSSGSISYVPTTSHHEMFCLTKFFSSFIKKSKMIYTQKNSFLYIKQSFFLIRQLPKKDAVSLLELLPNKGIQYARSTGVKATIIKMDSRVSTSLIKLPSGVKKIFSMYSLGSYGSVALKENRLFMNNSAGYYRNFGKKSIVRGVAMNPVDHPHGGRAKSVKYQRTPWGKTTKFK